MQTRANITAFEDEARNAQQEAEAMYLAAPLYTPPYTYIHIPYTVHL